MNSTLPSFRQPSAVERAFNKVFGFLVGLGLGFSYNYLLQVRGRKSGKIYSTPIDLLERGGKRFLVAPRGRTQWVRNAEAAGEVTLKKGSTRLQFRLRALSDQEKPGSDNVSDLWSSGSSFQGYLPGSDAHSAAREHEMFLREVELVRAADRHGWKYRVVLGAPRPPRVQPPVGQRRLYRAITRP